RSLVSMAYGIICFALFFSFVGTVLGGIWADQSWGRFWGWDPKENGALLIVLWNAIILHARWAGYVRERGIMAMAIFGNIITSLSWFGVNLLGVGLHSYGFTQNGFWALMGFDISQAVLMVLCLMPTLHDSHPKQA
ncbi:MAG TPA: cytochrome c biogenesis protein CcsA, partial [Holophagaceae bacterium]